MFKKNSFVKFSLTLIQIFTVSSFAISQGVWTKQFESAYFTRDFLDVQFIDQTQGWAVGDRGTIAHTTNGGIGWDALASGVTDDLHGVHFISSINGWVVGESGAILHTTDGGETWISQNSGTSSTLNKVFFTDENNGWVVGSSGKILHTSNGGQTWESQASGISRNLNNLFFNDSNTGWAVGDGGNILFTNNGGNSWQSQNSGVNDNLDAVFFVDTNQGWIVGSGFSGGTILQTNNGGQSWNSQTTGVDRILPLHDVFFLSDNEGWVVGENSVRISSTTFNITGYVVFRTTDGGTNWDLQIETTASSIFGGGYIVNFVRAAHFVSETEGWVVGQDGKLLHTTDGGQTWRNENFRRDINSIQFVSADDGWSVGSNGIIQRSKDGGSSWERILTDFSDDLNDLYFISSEEGWVAGDDYTIMYTDDGGETWTTQYSDSGSFREINAMSFVSDTEGWAVGGDSKKVLHTTNKGITWVEVQLPSGLTFSSLNDVYFSSTNRGWIATHYRIITTLDGGNTWESLDIGASFLETVYFTDDLNGWVVGRGGTILHTNDEGQSWVSQNTGTTAELQNVLFVNNNEGWAVGRDGIILHTIDSGNTWQPQESPTDVDLKSITFAGDTFLWAAGESGTIVKYIDETLPNYPRASFTVTPLNGNVNTIFTVDASGSFDNQDDSSELQVKWDWEDDGIFDTSFNEGKTETHQYTTIGPKTIRMEVKDTSGLTGVITRTIVITPVVSVFPAQNALLIGKDSQISATFGIDMDPTTVNDSTFIVFGSQSGQQSGVVSYDLSGRRALFDPLGEFISGEQVTVILTNEVKTIAGMNSGGHIWKFNVKVNNETEGAFNDIESYPVATQAKSMLCSDMDNDGNIDLIYASGNSGRSTTQISIRFNNGDGSFLDPMDFELDGGFGINSIISSDLNGDSLVDLAATAFFGSNGGVKVLLNQGNRTFSAPITHKVGGGSESVTSDDFDGDGDLDLAIANRNSDDVSILLNNGNATFSDPVSYPVGLFVPHITSADLDSDGDIDLVVFSEGSVLLFFNQGDGTFSLPSKQDTEDFSGGSIYVNDFNSDGYVDLAVAHDFFGDVQVLMNQGNGDFSAPIEHDVGDELSSITGGDLDGDGDIDLVVTNKEDFLDAGTTVIVLYNDGLGAFLMKAEFTVGTEPNSVCAGDFDNDGDLDLAVSNEESKDITVLLNNRERVFSFLHNYEIGTAQSSLSTGDINNDGFDDIVVTPASYFSKEILVSTNARNGAFDNPTRFAVSTGTPQFVYLNDLDKDVDLDAAFITINSKGVVTLFNNGDGAFSSERVVSAGGDPSYIFGGDFDGDMDVDLAITDDPHSQNGSLRIYFNDGSGNYTIAGNYGLGSEDPNTIDGDDFDNDGDLDLVISHSTREKNLNIVMNNGDGTFGNPIGKTVGSYANSIFSSDVDQDGDIDLLVGDFSDLFVLFNVGNGTFADPIVYPQAGGTSIFGSDFDGDNDVDLVITRTFRQYNSLQLVPNNGDGTFAMPSSYEVGVWPISVRGSDFDRDGDIDLAVANRSNDISLLFNNTNQPAPRPAIFTSTNILDFGENELENSQDSTFTLNNIGTESLIIEDIEHNSGSDYELVSPANFPVTLEPNSSTLTVVIRFTPSSMGEKVDTLTIKSNDPLNPELNVRLIGKGVQPTSVSSGETNGIPTTYDLSQNYPNPFNPETRIKYQLPKTSEVRLEIYNLLGQRVVTLVDKEQLAGFYSVKWNGKDESGRNVASGIYLYKLDAEGFVKVRKLTLLR